MADAFAHHENEEPEQTADHVAALEAELAGQEQRAETPEAGDFHVEKAKSRIPAIKAELARFGKRSRLRGESS